MISFTSTFASLAWRLGPLAQQERFVHMGRKFRRGSPTADAGDVIALIAVLVGIFVGVWLFARFFGLRNRSGYNNPRRLFRELCLAHGLDRSSRLLLRKLARWHQLAHPARLFLEPERFDAVRHDPAMQPRCDELLMLRDTIFGRRIDARKGGRPAGRA